MRRSVFGVLVLGLGLSGCAVTYQETQTAPSEPATISAPVVPATTTIIRSLTAWRDNSHMPRCLAFPDAPDGRHILAVDLHTHSVFSDGNVWPSIRVEEAQRDCLFAMAVTEHLEWQPHRDDIPHPDRNRSYNVAKEFIERRELPLVLIQGAEITRFFPPGHINAIFIEDANPLLFPRGPRRGEPLIPESIKALDAAKAQNAFIFWNHPAWTPDFPSGILEVSDFHKRMIAEDKLHGIEVANGQFYAESAFQTALDYELAILGTSDIHGLIDWDYDIANGGHRTTTLVLSEGDDYGSLEKAIRSKQTVALYKRTLIGRDAQLQPILKSVLALEKGDYRRRSTVLGVTLKNTAPFDIHLKNASDESFTNAGEVITVPAYGEADLFVADVEDADGLALRFEVLSAYKAPKVHPVLVLR